MAADSIVMLDAGALQIEHVERAQYWRLSRTPTGTEATLIEVWYLHIEGRAPRELRPATNYGAYFVYKLTPNAQGFRSDEVELIVGSNFKRCCLDPTIADHDVPTRREGEEWLEIEMGSFYNDGYSNAEVDLVVQDHNTAFVKSGLCVRGIELRPRTGP